METTLFGGPPELGNMLKLANGQIGFMTIFAHPLFANVADIIPAMRFAADEILTNKGVWFTRAEHEKRLQVLHKQGGGLTDSGAVSPRTQSPVGRKSTPDHTHLASSPLRERANTPDSERTLDHAERGRGRGSGAHTPQDHPRGSTLAAVAAIPVSGDNTTPTRSSSAKANSIVENRRKSGLVNGEHISRLSAFDGEQDLDSSTTPRLTSTKPDMSDESEQSLNDTRRDNAVSMRAGAEALPEDVMQDEKARESSAEALSKFNFATSDQDEPVRTFNPQRNYAAPNADARASAPAPTGNTEHQNPKVVGADDARQTQSEEVTNATLRAGSGNDALTPVQSTEASSYASEKSEDFSRIKRSFQAMRNRAASAPLSPGSPIMRPSFSMGSNSVTSRESSKLDVHATILSNGEVDESGDRDRKGSTRSVGRRRSKLKLNLAFWKRNKSEKSVGVDERPDSQGSEGR